MKGKKHAPGQIIRKLRDAEAGRVGAWPRSDAALVLPRR